MMQTPFPSGVPAQRPHDSRTRRVLVDPWLWVVLLAGLCNGVAAQAASWHPAPGRLMTRWASEVRPDKVHPEYPRPQLQRSDWENLNGLWDYAITDLAAGRPEHWDGQILVPFPVESALSGVMARVNENQRLWYRRTFRLPRGWNDRSVLLHFGAVDWEARVWVNGVELGAHRGGYDAFSFDLTPALNGAADQEIVVAVWDPTDAGTQPRGKQVRRPEGIWYTPTSGIWQTVWLEPVAPEHVRSLTITPDFDQSAVTVGVTAQGRSGSATTLKVEILEGRKVVQQGEVTAQLMTLSEPPQVSPRITLKVPAAKPWTPDTPFLYGLRVTLLVGGKQTDALESYFGMRKIALGKDAAGFTRLMLNNEPVFQFGPLDQGFWPDGLYTAPTDEALRYDIEMTKKLGFNLARKHVKVEPDRWYYWCDKLGLLVWQDMPSGDRYIGGQDPDLKRTPESAAQFEAELKALIQGRFNHPCIVMWVPFNEGWGQYDTARIVDWVKAVDPTRLVDNASGWTDRGVGDVMDIHVYPGPGAPEPEAKRAGVLGEFGGLGLPVRGHTWQDERNWGYRSFKNSADLTEAYVDLTKKLRALPGDTGLSAAVYTQTTDVEVEVNGLMTYDRAQVKMGEKEVTAANQAAYLPLPKRKSEGATLVPPATPLVACDPYFSIWSPADKLTEADTVHWTGRPHRLTSLVRIDGKTHRLMGATPGNVPALDQKSLTVLPTRTVYEFEGAGVSLTVTFLTAALPEQLELLSRPVTYLTWEARSLDSKPHDVAVYFDASGEITVNTPNQEVEWSSEAVGELAVARIGSREQPVLARKGDDLRIDWGYLYVAAPAASVSARAFASRRDLQTAFAENGLRTVSAPLADAPRAAEDVAAGFALSLGKVSQAPVSRWLMLAYDDLFSIQYMKQNLRPYWRRQGWEAADLLQAAAKDYPSLTVSCAAFDAELMADLEKAGGVKYARICALAYRQCFAAGKFVADAHGQPLQFCKENHSNGCIATSDVFYPMAPQFLLLGPTLAKSFLVPFMNYAASERWRFPFAPHDLGTYPHANGQVYGDGERGVNNQMPVEESGNLLILMASVAQMEGNADFAALYWPQLEQWAAYLKEKGFDPENQLCTDDFAGHLAHNVNLSAKAICGLGAFAKLCALRGDSAKAAEYQALAKEFAQRWVKEARDVDHFRLAFDKPGTWSQKYNLIWDRILGLDLFPAEVARLEMDYYRKTQNAFGLPLDNRQTYTKLDWILWTATLTQDRGDFETLVDPVFRFLNETPDRSPMTDWYQTKTARKVGFTARPVVGGVFAQMLYDKATWAKYAGRDQTKAAQWAPMPKAPVTKILVPGADSDASIAWQFTFRKPADDWFQPDFVAQGWKEGRSGFGTRGTPGAVVHTEWNTPDIWLRRDFTLPEAALHEVQLWIHHDEDVEVFLNGILAARLSGYSTEYETAPIRAEARAALRPGRNVLAVHCHQTGGGQYIDAGLVEIVPAGRP